MKKIVALVAVVLIFGCISRAGKQENEIIRFHVKANSDTTEDQELKLKVRDRVIDYMNPKLENADSVEEARSILKNEIPGIKACAEQSLAENGSTYPVKVSLSHREFPTRIYDGVEYPQGVYEALMVEIGEAEGQNWWCVAYPNMCYVPLDGKIARRPARRSLFRIIRSWFR